MAGIGGRFDQPVGNHRGREALHGLTSQPHHPRRVGDGRAPIAQDQGTQHLPPGARQANPADEKVTGRDEAAVQSEYRPDQPRERALGPAYFGRLALRLRVTTLAGRDGCGDWPKDR